MAILGVARVKSINSGSTDPTKIDVVLEYVGIKAGQSVTVQTLSLTDMDVTVLNITWENALKTAVKNVLINSFLYTFGLFDNVLLVGETLI